MATKQAGVWGIDLGQCALKALRLELVDGQVTATAYDYIEHPKILSQPDADPDQLTREALEQFLSRNDLKGDVVAISVPGQSGLARFVKLPPVEEKKIGDIVKFEAKQQIPFPLEEVVWDYQKVGSGTVSDGYALETEIGLFAMKRDMVTRALQQFKDVNVEVNIVQMAPLALCNFVAYELLQKNKGDEPTGSKECVVALDIGADTSSLVITDGEKIIWQRPIPLGGNHFTRALTKDLKLTFAKAEHVKRNAIKSPDLKKILTALRPVLNDFVNEVQRSLGYFTNTHRDANVQYMIGLGNAFRLPGLQKFLQEKLGLEVRKLGSLDRLQGDEVIKAPQFTENVLSFAVAYGLSLQGLGLTKIETNLLPPEIRTERLIRAKKPWALATAAALLLAVGALTFSKSVQYSAVANENVAKAITQSENVISQVGGINSTYSGHLAKIEESKVAVNHIASGVAERFNWNLIYKYVNDCLPKADPDDPRITYNTERNERAREKYVTPEARTAYQLWLKRQDPDFNKDENPDTLRDLKEKEFIKKHLLQVNVEGIDCLYSEDLKPFFKNILVDTKELLIGMSAQEKSQLSNEAEQEKLPQKGWVFAIRGYVHHWHEEYFIINTLLENLRDPQAKGVELPIDAETRERIRKHMGYFVLYRYHTINNPEPGVLQFASASPLRDLLTARAAAGGVPGGDMMGSPADGGDPMGDPMMGGVGGAPKRDSWVPIGEVASAALGAGVVGGAGAEGGAAGSVLTRPTGDATGAVAGDMTTLPLPPGAADVERQPRTEFVILFVWQEPTTIGNAEGEGGAPPEAAPEETPETAPA